MNLSKKDREQLRVMFGGRCAYCGCELPAKGWHADHVEPVYREWWKTKEWNARQRDFTFDEGRLVSTPKPYEPIGMTFPERHTAANLFPSCRACNIDKSASSLQDWRRQMENRVNVCRRNYSAFRHAERFGLVQEVKQSVVFWFERYATEQPAQPSADGSSK